MLASEERLRLAQDAGGIVTWEWKRGHRRGGLDRADARPAGARAGRALAVLQRLSRSGAPGRRRRGARAAARDPRGRGNRSTRSFRIVRPDGSVRWLAGRGEVARNDVGEPRRMMGVNYDVTERRGGDRGAGALQRRAGGARRGGRGQARPAAEDGEPGPAHGRHRARLQQPAHGGPERADAPPEAAARRRGRPAADRQRRAGRRARRLPHPAHAGLRPQAGARSPGPSTCRSS